MPHAHYWSSFIQNTKLSNFRDLQGLKEYLVFADIFVRLEFFSVDQNGTKQSSMKGLLPGALCLKGYPNFYGQEVPILAGRT